MDLDLDSFLTGLVEDDEFADVVNGDTLYKDAKKVYAGIVAAGLRAKETVLETAEKVQASASDVLAEAQEINEARNEEIFEENK